MTGLLSNSTPDAVLGTSASISAPKGRKLVLFPGAFRPPHRAHFNTVVNLATRTDIDEVVIIITNRCRRIPGTSKMLDSSVALKIWSIYLQNLSTVRNKIRVEVAVHSAVKHAVGYFEKAQRGDTLLFCVGEKDFRQGTGRFNKIKKLSSQYDIVSSIIKSPVPELDGGATIVRSHLVDGSTGRDAFMTCLPRHLSSEQCEQVWKICCEGMQEMEDVAIQHIQSIVERNGFKNITLIDCAKSKKMDPVFRVRIDNGDCLFVKYANDTVKADQLGQPQRLKPRNRLYAEKRALKWLAANNPDQVKIPKVICFEKKTKTLILDDVSGGGRLLEDDLKQAVFDPQIARQASRFLAVCHTIQPPNEPFWGSDEADHKHWETMLNLRAINNISIDYQLGKLTSSISDTLQSLRRASQNAMQRAVYHLDYCPKNIFVHDKQISVIDFEMSSTIGDPAFDFGCLLGHYLWWGMITTSNKACLENIRIALQAYRVGVSTRWTDISSRIAPFAATVILSRLAIHSHHLKPVFYHQLLETAFTLLASNLVRSEEIEQLFTVVSARICNADRQLPTEGESHEFSKDYRFVH